MQEQSEIETRALALPPALQAVFLTGCVEHVVLATEKINALPTELFDEVVAPGLQAVWDFATLGKVSPNVEIFRQTLDNMWGKLKDELQHEVLHVAAASLLVVESLPAPGQGARRCLNHLDEFIDLVDPQPDDGIEEEEGWRGRLLSSLERWDRQGQPERDMLSSLQQQRMDWVIRYQKDWNK